MKKQLEIDPKMEFIYLNDKWMHRCPICWRNDYRYKSSLSLTKGFIDENVEWKHEINCPLRPVPKQIKLDIEQYGWMCPNCAEYNYEDGLSNMVECCNCDEEYEVSNYQKLVELN
jgi:ribosomal protein L37AE/L43A